MKSHTRMKHQNEVQPVVTLTDLAFHTTPNAPKKNFHSHLFHTYFTILKLHLFHTYFTILKRHLFRVFFYYTNICPSHKYRQYAHSHFFSDPHPHPNTYTFCLGNQGIQQSLRPMTPPFCGTILCISTPLKNYTFCHSKRQLCGQL